MRGNKKKILFAITVLTLVWLPVVHAEDTEAQLRWKNGDTLPGHLLESESESPSVNAEGGKVRWASPHFSDDLIVDTSVLDAIVFPNRAENPPTEAFRIGTISGDIWIADLIGSDDNAFVFSSKRHGQFRVNREMIYTFEGREHSNLLFDGSQLSAWALPEEDKGENAVQHLGNTQPSWHADRVGRPRTNQTKANIFYALDWPKRFEIDLELASAARPPSFVVAFGKNLYETVRLETWVNELVVVQGTLFESVLTIQPDRRNFRLRITYHETSDANAGVLRILDLNGNVLLELDEVRPTVEAAGIYIYNRGQDLTLNRLRVYKQPTQVENLKFDASKPRVHLMNGKIISGKLFFTENARISSNNGNRVLGQANNQSYVLDTDGTRTDINLSQIDRVVQPGITLAPTPVSHESLTYIDGSVLRGQITQLHPDRVLIQTAFGDEPLTCSLAGASLLQFSTAGETQTSSEDYDKLFYESGSLLGHVLFDLKGTSNLRWRPVGAVAPVRLANARGARVERSLQRVSRQKPFDAKKFPHLLHLKNGEVVPCQILFYDEETLGFQSPFIGVQHIDSEYLKGVEFSGKRRSTRTENRNPITITGGKGKHRIILEDGRILNAVTRRTKDGKVEIVVLPENVGEEPPRVVVVDRNFAENDAVALKRGVELMFDPLETQTKKLDAKLERALTVPRFNRDNPPNHILVAKNGDLKRGKLLGINRQTIQFESKLREFYMPIDQVARVVDVSENSSQSSVVSNQLKSDLIKSETSSTENQKPKTDNAVQSEVRVSLIDNPLMIFEPFRVENGKLLGRSSIYGEISVPVDSIQYLHFGEKARSFRSVFEEWVVRPAEEPSYDAAEILPADR